MVIFSLVGSSSEILGIRPAVFRWVEAILFRPAARCFLVLLLSCLLVSCSSPSHSPFYYGPYKVELPSNVWRLRMKKQQAREELGTPVEGKYYLVGQFKDYPTACRQNELQGLGVQLLQYMGAQTFFLSIDTATLEQALSQSKLTSLFPPEWRWKCDAAIVNDEVPPDAFREDGSMAIVVAPYSGYPLEWIQAKLLTLNIEGKHVYATRPFNTFALWLPRDIVISLAQEGWVRYISLAGPEVVR